MSFQNPAFLYGLFAILIPIAIHFFNFRRHKKILFSNVALLKQITVETKKTRNLLHLFVLLLRIFTLVFLVIALSKPEFGKKEPVIQVKTQHIYIDNSFSMLSEGSRGRLFNSAINDARLLAQNSPEDFRYTVRGNDFSERQQKKLNPDETLAALDQLRISSTESNLSDVALSLVNKENHQTKLLFFSDFQRYKTDIGQLPNDSSLSYLFFPFESSKSNNLFADSVWFSEPLLIPNKKSTCYIRITNKSAQYYEKLPVTLTIDGQQKGVAGIDLTAYSSFTLSISYTPQSSGWKYGLISIEDYPVTFDDALFFTFRVVPHISILAISDKGNSPILRSFFKSDSLFAFSEAETKRINYNALSDFNFLIINGISEYSSGLTQQLIRYMESGGNLLIISGNNLSEQSLLTNTKIGSIAYVDTTKTRVSGIKVKSSLFKNSINKIPENADLPTVNQHTAYQFPSKAGVESLLTLLNGHDLLATRQVGKGRIYLLATGTSPPFSSIASNLLFAPTIGGMATASGSPEKLFYFIGENLITLNKNVKHTGDEPIVMINKESGQTFIPEKKVDFGQINLLLHGNILASGYYDIKLHDSLISTVAFNYNRRESDLAYYTPAQLDSLCNLAKLPHFTIVNNSDYEFEEMISNLQKENPIWKLFIIFALLLLVAEGLVLRLRK